MTKMKYTGTGNCIFCTQKCDGHNYWHKDCYDNFVKENKEAH